MDLHRLLCYLRLRVMCRQVGKKKKPGLVRSCYGGVQSNCSSVDGLPSSLVRHSPRLLLLCKQSRWRVRRASTARRQLWQSWRVTPLRAAQVRRREFGSVLTKHCVRSFVVQSPPTFACFARQRKRLAQTNQHESTETLGCERCRLCDGQRCEVPTCARSRARKAKRSMSSIKLGHQNSRHKVSVESNCCMVLPAVRELAWFAVFGCGRLCSCSCLPPRWQRDHACLLQPLCGCGRRPHRWRLTGLPFLELDDHLVREEWMARSYLR